jgi:hypothetical protein
VLLVTCYLLLGSTQQQDTKLSAHLKHTRESSVTQPPFGRCQPEFLCQFVLPWRPLALPFRRAPQGDSSRPKLALAKGLRNWKWLPGTPL